MQTSISNAKSAIRRIAEQYNIPAEELGKLKLSPAPSAPIIQSPEDCFAILAPKMMSFDREHMIVVLLNTRNEVMDTIDLYTGTLNSSTIRVAEIFRQAIIKNAAAIILAHNHPSGDPTPSPEDVNVTRGVRKAGKLLDIELLDHLVIGNGRYFSLKAHNMGFE